MGEAVAAGRASAASRPSAHRVPAALSLMVASRLVAALIVGVGLVILARLLPPAVFGAYAVALALAGVGEALSSLGLKSFLVREGRADRHVMGSAVGLCCIATLLVTVITIVIAWLVPGPWLPQGARSALVVLLAGQLLIPLTLPIEAALEREVRFAVSGMAFALRSTVEALISVGLVLAGAEVMALAIGVAAGRLASAVVFVAVGRTHLVNPHRRGWGAFLRFGGEASGAVLLVKLAEVGTAVLIGRVLGAAALGFLDRARSLLVLFDRTVLDGIQPVILPAFARSIEEGAMPARLLAMQVGFVAAIAWPVFAVMMVEAELLVAIALGPDWASTVPLLRILLIGGFFMPLTRMTFSFYAAIGQTGTYLVIQAVTTIATLMLVGVGVTHSVEAAALGVVLGTALKAGLVLTIARRTGVRTTPVLVALGRAVPMVGAAVIGAGLVPGDGVFTLTGIVSTSAVFWLATLVVTRHPMTKELAVALRKLYRAAPRRGQAAPTGNGLDQVRIPSSRRV